MQSSLSVQTILQDCGHPYYVANYIAFYEALRVAYPHMQLIANCNLGQDAPTDIWDWHLYTNSWEMFKARGAFDGMVPGRDPLVFASEYAVVDDSGFGNLKVRVVFGRCMATYTVSLWHLYTSSWEMFKARGAFDGISPERFWVAASEYAVVDDSSFGNLKVQL